MCGRVYIKTTLEGLMRAFSFARSEGAEGLSNQFPRYNGAPGQDYPIIIRDVVRDPGLSGHVFVSARWGLIPSWAKDTKIRPINATCETIKTNGMFRSAYRARRCLVPINGYFEWKDILGTGKNKQPYAIALKSGGTFALAGIWETWRDAATDEDIRTFAVVTCLPNELMATIHTRMPVLLHEEDYKRWLSDDPDPGDLMVPFPSDLMTMWPIGKNVAANTREVLDEIDSDPEPTLVQ